MVRCIDCEHHVVGCLHRVDYSENLCRAHAKTVFDAVYGPKEIAAECREKNRNGKCKRFELKGREVV